MSDGPRRPALATSGHVGAAGEAAFAARLLREGRDVARPIPDPGVDLVVLGPEFARAVPCR